MNVWSFQDAWGRATGPGAAAINLEKLGWLDDERFYYSQFSENDDTFELTCLNRPDVDGPYVAVFVAAEGSNDPYYIEYREPTAWDAGLPGPRVLVHRVNQEGGAMIVGAGGDPSGALSAGESVDLPLQPYPAAIRVEAIDPVRSKATVTVWIPDQI
jgi:hypothetical protein